MSDLKAKILDISTGRREILLNANDLERLMIRLHDRVRVSNNHQSATAVVEVTDSLVKPGFAGIGLELKTEIDAWDGSPISLTVLEPPASVKHIRKKMRGEALGKEEVLSIIRDAVNGNLNEMELAAFLLAQHFVGMGLKETQSLTEAMVETGDRMEFDRPVYDKHSVGGVPGNKISLLVVPIVAAAGLLIPKTSSRAITSPSGTADTMSVLAPVKFTADELKRLALKTNGAIVWGGGLNLAPADDVFINVEHVLNIDPESQMLASILSKKLAVGADNLVIDLPTGMECKIETKEQARELSNKFSQLARNLGIQIRCAITYGGQPIGHAVGPALEAREALSALAGKGPTSLIEKSTAIAGLLLELSGRAAKGQGQPLAKEILESGKALRKMKEIIEAQGGDPNISPDDIPIGKHKATVKAPCDGWITVVSNHTITAIARAAGAPAEKDAGVILSGKIGRKVEKGEVVIEIYAERESKLDYALSIAGRTSPFTIEGMLLEELPEF